MAEQLELLNLGERSDGIRVMGMNSDGSIFKGVTKEVISRVNLFPSILTVEGISYNGINDICFIGDYQIERLKVYNENEFSESRLLLQNYITAINNANRCKKQCRRLLA